MRERIKSLTPPGTVLAKPESKASVLRWTRNNQGVEQMVYSFANSKKYVKLSDFEKAIQELQRTGEFTRSWFKSNLDPNKSSGCNFTTIGVVLEKLGVATYVESSERRKSGKYRKVSTNVG